MIKVISIAVSTLLLGNIALADTTNTDTTLLQSIQQNSDTKKSNLGANVQAKSGLSGLNKNSVRDNSKPLENLNSSEVVQVNSSKMDSVNIKANTPVNTPDVKLEVKSDVKSNVNVDKKLVTNVNKDSNKTSEKPNKLNEVCEPVKPTVKKVFKKKVLHKPTTKLSNVPVKNDFELSKTQNYTPIDFSNKQRFILNTQVKLSLQERGNNFEVSISDNNDQVIPKEQFNKSFLRVVQISQNFETITHQENELNFVNTTYNFNKDVKNCAAVFVQYHLNSSAIATNLVKYLDKNGSLTDHIDSSCKQDNPEDLATNINYSVSNNVSGLFFKNNKLLSTRPVNFNIVFSKEGSTRTPNDLFVYTVKSDFSDLRVIEPKTYGNAASGVIFETNLEKGKYILGYTFKENKTEGYLKNIHVE